LCFVGVPPLVHCPGPLSHSLLFTSPEVLVLLPPPASGLTAYDSTSTGRISRLGAQGWEGVCFKQELHRNRSHYLFVFVVRAISWTAPARCNIRSSRRLVLVLCFSAAALSRLPLLLWTRVWDSGAALRSSCFLQVVVVIVVWFLCEHLVVLEEREASCAALLSCSR